MSDFNNSRSSEYEYYTEEYNVDVADGDITRKKFNLIMGATVLYGVLLNVLMCIFCVPIALAINPIILLVGYIVLAFVGVFMAHKSDNPAISFLGYNLLVVPLGLVLSVLLLAYGGVTSPVVLHAFIMTMEITAIMVVASVVFPNFFERIGGFLFIALIGIVIASLIEMIISRNFYVVSFFSAVIFSLYIGHDIRKAQKSRATVDNAVDCALDIYLDIINLFMRLLSISGSKSNRN